MRDFSDLKLDELWCQWISGQFDVCALVGADLVVVTR